MLQPSYAPLLAWSACFARGPAPTEPDVPRPPRSHAAECPATSHRRRVILVASLTLLLALALAAPATSAHASPRATPAPPSAWCSLASPAIGLAQLPAQVPPAPGHTWRMCGLPHPRSDQPWATRCWVRARDFLDALQRLAR